jgi:hypothetical protein
LKITAALAISLLLFVSASTAQAAGTTVWAVGDGADSNTHDDVVAAMIEQRSPDAFLYLGDVYESGTAGEFASFYDTGYGRLRQITYPTPGNHEWDRHAEGYDPYWGSRFASPHYYSFDLGGWHLISLNSEQDHGEGSGQLAWLRSDLSERSGDCTLAFWHRPRYSAGQNHGDDSSFAPVWGSLAGRASIVLTAHDHGYQRFKPINGITNWVVGTGGHGLTGIRGSDPRLAVYNETEYGVLRLTLTRGRAEFAFVNSSGGVLDSGAVGCDPAASRGKADTRSPRITRAKTDRKRFRIGPGSKLRIAVRYRLSERARVTIRLEREFKGETVSLRTLSQRGRKGRNTKRFSAVHSGRPLRPGSYRVVLEATDLVGNVSKPKTVRFRISKPR